MLNVKTESIKINILSSQLLIFPCVITHGLHASLIINETTIQQIIVYKRQTNL